MMHTGRWTTSRSLMKSSICEDDVPNAVGGLSRWSRGLCRFLEVLVLWTQRLKQCFDLLVPAQSSEGAFRFNKTGCGPARGHVGILVVGHSARHPTYH